MIIGVQAVHQFLDHRLVFADQAPFHPPFGSDAENIERCAPQPLQPCQDLERGHHPGPEFSFLQFAGIQVAGGNQRRRQVEGKLEPVSELAAEPGDEFTFRIKPGDLVFVLVGEELEIGPGDGVCEAGLALGHIHLGDADPVDHVGVTPGIVRILVLGQILDAFGNEIQGLGRFRFGFGRPGDAFNRVPVIGGPAAPQECLAVEIDGDAVELQRTIDGFRRKRQQAFLIGEPDQKHVGGDGVAQQRQRQPRGVDEFEPALAGGFGQGVADAFVGESKVGVVGEVSGHGSV